MLLLKRGKTLEALGKSKAAYNLAKGPLRYHMLLSDVHYKLAMAHLALGMVDMAR